MSLHAEVRGILEDLCERVGVDEEQNGDLRVSLGRNRTWIHVDEDARAVAVYREILADVPQSAALDETLNEQNRDTLVFRTFWHDDSVFLRGDVIACPLSSAQLQHVLDEFDALANAAVEQMQSFVEEESGSRCPWESDADDRAEASGSDRPRTPQVEGNRQRTGETMTATYTFQLKVAADGEPQTIALGTALLETVIGALDGDDATNAGFFAAAAAHPSASVRERVAAKKCLPVDAALTLATDVSSSVRQAVLQHTGFRRVARERLIVEMMSTDPGVARAVAGMLNRFEMASISVLCDAVEAHPDPGVRLVAAQSENTPSTLLHKLCRDVMADVAAAANRNLTVKFR